MAPRLWPRRRIYSALHRLRHLNTVRDTGVQGQPRQAYPVAPRGEAHQPKQLRAGRISEKPGAEKGYELQEYGEPDAYGHRKKASVRIALSTRSRAQVRGGDDHLRPHLQPAIGRSGLHRQACGRDFR